MQSDKITYLIGYRDKSGEFWCEGEYDSEEFAYIAWHKAIHGMIGLNSLELIKATTTHKTLAKHDPKQMLRRAQTLDELLSECVLMEADSQATRTMEKAIAAITKLRGALLEIVETSGDKPYDPRIDITCKRIARKALE